MRSLLRPDEVAEALSISEYTLANWRSRAQGPAHIKVGRLVRYREDAVAEWLGEREYADSRSSREVALPLRDKRARVVRQHRLGGHRTKPKQGDAGGGRIQAACDSRTVTGITNPTESVQ